MRTFHVVATALLLASPAVARAQAVTRSVNADVTVTIRAHNGEVRIEGWDRNQVEVQGRSSEMEDIKFSGDAAALRVDARDHRGRISVRVPAGARVDLRTENGGLRVAGLTGAVRFESVSGGAQIDGTPNAVDIETVSGGVTLLQSARDVRINTISGGVRIGAASGSVDVSTASGGVEIVSRGLTRARVSTASGTIRYSGTYPEGARVELESASGVTEIVVPRRVSAVFDLATVTGRVFSDLGPAPRRDRYTRGDSLHFTEGGGAARIEASNVSGTIRLTIQ